MVIVKITMNIGMALFLLTHFVMIAWYGEVTIYENSMLVRMAEFGLVGTALSLNMVDYLRQSQKKKSLRGLTTGQGVW